MLTKKQLAIGAATVLGALVTALSQCKDETPVLPRTGTTAVDAGAR
jgi:hypothetical protein